jgi:phosphoribosylglycinamide formyltransferase 1
MSKKRIGVLISGRGSNLEALIAACAEPEFPARIAAVVSNRPAAAGLRLAQEAGLPALAIDHKNFPSREAFDEALHAALRDADVELVLNAGFMRILTPGFVNAWLDRHLNIHPSLLPAFQGLRVHERVIESGARISGATVHFVRAEMDAGPIVAQAATLVAPGDTPETLAARVLELEHKLYPLALRLVASGAVHVENGRVIFSSAPETENTSTLFSPSL